LFQVCLLRVGAALHGQQPVVPPGFALGNPLDAYLELLDERGNVVDVDDNNGGSASARLTTSVEPGTYYVVAKPFADQGYAVGAYRLVMK